MLGIQVEFRGSGIDEVGVVVNISGDRASQNLIGKEIIRINPRYFRPTEVDTLLGDSLKAKNDLGWKSEISVEEMCKEMVEEDYKSARRQLILKEKN